MTLVKIKYDGTEYSVDKYNLTYDADSGKYTLTVDDDANKTMCNITITSGEITSTETMSVTVNVGDGTIYKEKILQIPAIA